MLDEIALLEWKLWLLGIFEQCKETLNCKRESAALKAHLHPQRSIKWLDETVTGSLAIILSLLVLTPSCLRA